MQIAAHESIYAKKDLVLLSPTGTGKTLAFLLPVMEDLDATLPQVQAIILVPSRELALQIEQVAKEMGTGLKINALYGGRIIRKDMDDLKHPPALLIGTPGRLADHFKRRNVNTKHIKVLVLDEFDKSLEVGFEKEMRLIIEQLPLKRQNILTSASEALTVPPYVNINEPVRLNYLDKKVKRLQIKTIEYKNDEMLRTLFQALCYLGELPGIIFCNYKDTIEALSRDLNNKGIVHGCFFGGMEQKERERSLLKFRNGTHRLIIATDLAARGIDVPEIRFIIHYQIPQRAVEFTHRNGRTARMHQDGTAYVLCQKGKPLPSFVEANEPLSFKKRPLPKAPKWVTLFISAGRKDKISKGDIAGWFLKQTDLTKEQLGLIELKQDCAFVAVPKNKASSLIHQLKNQKLKKQKVRVVLI